MIKKISIKNLNVFSRFEPVSFEVDVQNATTELQDSITYMGNTTTY